MNFFCDGPDSSARPFLCQGESGSAAWICSQSLLEFLQCSTSERIRLPDLVPQPISARISSAPLPFPSPIQFSQSGSICLPLTSPLWNTSLSLLAPGTNLMSLFLKNTSIIVSHLRRNSQTAFMAPASRILRRHYGQANGCSPFIPTADQHPRPPLRRRYDVCVQSCFLGTSRPTAEMGQGRNEAIPFAAASRPPPPL